MSGTVAVLGLGSIGTRHMRNLLALGRPVIGFDPDAARREAAGAAGAMTTASRDEALSKVSIAVVGTPNECHFEDLSAAVEAGCHVLVEKPLSHTTKGLSDVLHKAEIGGTLIFAGYNLRFCPAVRLAKTMLDEHRVGEVMWTRIVSSSYLPSWRPQNDYTKGYTANPVTGGVIYDLIHEMDLAAHLLGKGTVRAAFARRTGFLAIEAEDTAEIILEHPNGSHSTLHLDYVTRPPSRVIEIACSEGKLIVDIRLRKLTVQTPDHEHAEEHVFDGTAADDYIDEMKNFLNAVDGLEPPMCTGWEALETLNETIAARRMSDLPCLN